ncbi:MAG TPA: GAF domain-containing protein, partial [Ignavibacteria bacterium]|nr:GAF domain-containing protein [Ignavibacteria bacterium]
MDRIQRKRILIFMLIPILAVLLFITENMVIRIIVAMLLVIYVAFIIFLRDSSKYSESFDNREETAPFEEDEKDPEIEESFQILSNHKKIEVITADSYRPESKLSKPTLKPPDLKERFEEIVNEVLPEGIDHNGQFTFVIDKILSVLKEAYMAHTALFFWYNKKNEKLSIEKFISSSTDIAQRKFDLEDDILSKIVQKGEPELLNDISPAAETDVIRYYNSPQGIKSFVGVPLFYDKRLIAIIVIDSKMSDAFGVETIYALGRFVRVITIIIAIFEEKHSDTISQQRLKGLLNLMNPDFKFTSEQDILTALEKSIKFFIPWDAYAFIYYHPLGKKFKTIKVINNTSLKYIGDNFDIDLNETLVGKSILTGMPVKIDDTSKDEFIRF